MGSKAENCQGLGAGSRGYLFFGNELHVGSAPDEEHEGILKSSRKLKAEVLVAGGILVSGNRIIIDGGGSLSLAIEARDPTPVAEFIGAFPDAGGKSITPMNG
ncbi:MAG: hypothetical protein AAB506_03160 [Patescibacteria group bacterium]